MSETVGDYLLERLATWGIKRIYGYPGDGINGILGAFTRSSNGQRPEFIQVRHEEMAAFMACAHAKFHRRARRLPGHVRTRRGSPAEWALRRQARSPARRGDRRAAGARRHGRQLSAGDRSPEPVQGRRPRVRRGGDGPGPDPTPRRPRLPDRARRADGDRDHHPQRPPGRRCGGATAAQARDGPLRSRLPSAEAAPDRRGSRPRRRGPECRPEGRHARRAGRAARLRRGGRDGRHARRRRGQGAARQGRPPRRSSVRDRLDRSARNQAELDADAGVRHAPDGRLELPLLGVPARGGQGARRADRHRRADARDPLPDGGQPGRRQCRDAPRADAAPRAQGGSLMAREDRSRGRGVVESDGASRAPVGRSDQSPARLPRALQATPDGAIISADSGSSANWYARDVRLRKGMMASLSGTLATMGPGVPYAIAAKFAYPSRPVFALVGDGAMQMNGINELITIAKYRHRWADQRLVVLVLNNRDLNQVTLEQRAMEGNPKFEGSQDLPDFPYARYAELLGLHGIRVDSPERVGPAWDEALSSDRPVVYEAVTDPEVPPLPPHITLEQAKALSSALMSGDPNAGRIVRQSFAQKIQEFLPGR